VENAKKVYKYHRAGGYVILTTALATVAAATQTDYVKGILGIQLWAVIVASVVTLAGVLPRIKKQKLGLGVARDV
jgi:type IV secretory pathway TrbD component